FLRIASASRPETWKSLLSSQASINFSLFLRKLRSPKRGSSKLMALDSVRYTAKFPADRTMWYSNVVPERPHPITNTGASFRGRVFTFDAFIAAACPGIFEKPFPSITCSSLPTELRFACLQIAGKLPQCCLLVSLRCLQSQAQECGPPWRDDRAPLLPSVSTGCPHRPLSTVPCPWGARRCLRPRPAP